jgi:hypothetical protein
MSLQFSDTSNYLGIIQRIEDHCGFNYGDITGNTTLFKKFTAKVNMAQNKAWSIIIPASGSFQWDDNNHDDYPIIRTNIVSGQRDHSFTNDEDGNRILDIFKVAILKSATATIHEEISPIDINDNSQTAKLLDSVTTGVPEDYDKLGNGIRFGVIPNYDATNGLLMYVNREGYYFTTASTTQKPGFDGRFHEYLALAPSYEYARDNGLANAEKLFRDMTLMEQDMTKTQARREKDVRNVMSGKRINFI